MQYRYRVIRLVVVIPLMLLSLIANGRSWESELQNGSRIQVDPTTNRGTIVTPQGARTQLWNGVHRLSDGSEITVRSGVVIPNEEIMDIEQGMPQRRPAEEAKVVSSCTLLVHKVCGPHDECSSEPSCNHANQLLAFEKEEQQDGVSGFEEAPQQCRDAMSLEDFFKPCVKARTPCLQLVAKVCGAEGQCAQQPACDAAKQLLEMETKESLSSPGTEAQSYGSGKCGEALKDESFFALCGS